MTTAQQEILKTLEAYKAGGAPQIGLLSPDIIKDWNIATGFQAYNLQPVALLMFPQLTPIRNMTARVQGKGKKAEYKGVTALNNTNLQGFVAEGSAASLVQTTTVDITATYKSFALGDKVTFESQWSGVGFTDVKALAVTNLLRAAMIAEENAIIFGQSNGAANATEQAPGAAGQSPQPTLAATGADGSISFGTYYIKQTVVTGMGESTPSTAVSQSVGTSQHLTITPVFPTTQPVIGFKFYWSSSSGGTYSEIKAADISGGAKSNGTLPGGSLAWYTNGDAINVLTLTGGNAAPPVSDGSASANAFNGIYPQMWGGSGATLTNAAGALTTTLINNMFKSLWNNAKADPDAVWCNAQESIKLNGITLGNGTPYYLVVDNTAGATANFRVARLTNPVTGSEVPVRVHPTSPQGTMLFLSSKLPGWYVPTDVPSVWEMDLPQDYVEIDYPPNQSNPFWQVEVRFYGALKLYIPGLQGALYGINNS